jgi:hypothetical protein
MVSSMDVINVLVKASFLFMMVMVKIKPSIGLTITPKGR